MTRIHRCPKHSNTYFAAADLRCRIRRRLANVFGVERWRWTLDVCRQPMTTPFRIIAADHTGFTVANIERSLAFWQGVLGFELSHRAHHKGDLAGKVTGVPGAEISIAVLKAPGHRIELLEYHAPPDRKRVDVRPCDVGSAHVALTVDNLDAVLSTIAA